MILIKRKETNEIMNDRQSSDFPEHKQALLDTLLVQLSDGGITAEQQEAIQGHIIKLTDGRDRYYANRINAIVSSFGGFVPDYEIVRVPEGQKADAMAAQYVMIEDGKIKCVPPQKPMIAGGVLTIPGKRWVKGNYALTEDAIIDIGALSLPDKASFKICAYLSGGAVELALFWREEDEDYASQELPGKYYLGDVCQGIVGAGNVILIQ